MADNTNMTNENLLQPLASSISAGDPVMNQRIRPSRRSRHRSGWEQPASPPTPVNSLSISDNTVLYDIVFCLMRLNLCIPRTATNATDYRDQSLFGWEDRNYITTLLPEELASDGNLNWYQGHEPQERKLREYVESLTRTQLDQYIRDVRTLSYLSRLFEQMIILCQRARARKQVVEQSPDFTIAADFIAQFGEEVSRDEYAGYCVVEYRQSMVDLRFIYNVALQLRNHIPEAVSQGLLAETSLVQLKLKMSAMQEHFHETCRELDKPTQDLLWDTHPWWNEEPSHVFLDQDQKNIAHAYQQSPGINSTLTFLVPVLSLISSIPICLAWMRSSHKTGNISDADFYQLISSSSMQLLSIMTLIIPTVSNVRLAKLAWFWTWILASVGTLCAVAAVPLYLYLSPEWSMVISFAASVAQALVILQFMFAL